VWLIAFLAVVDVPALSENAPKAAITLPCEVIEWHDGDTGTVRVTLDVRVRLLDCWAPEIRGKNVTAVEKAKGQESLKSVLNLAPVGSKGMLEIPLDGYDRTDDAFTMGRVLGRVWINGKNISASQVDSGHATAVKSSWNQ
jgi:endonuclease YncB( thermonuclease family)